MALKATIFKAELTVSDTDRGYYATHALTLARHPSETDERMMVRLLAFALHASDNLQFTTGLSTEGEPDLWQKSPSNEIDLWIDVGLPDEKQLRRACGRARQVVVYAYGGNKASIWWAKTGAALARCDNLTVFALAHEATGELAALAARGMNIACMVSDGEIWLSDATKNVGVEPTAWMTARPGKHAAANAR
ncbi:MAG: YaeQ protein [Candidatus Accumulibacter appositus]|uniref:YaeQ protein n=1 Tax=Candidatus Accumulibacter appositus TaxID=1454003 RepID=A0A011NTN2_9PROT|nr:YaeQ family protein [Accumulibacter sp.]EXI78711.1 MAG: YaeQ protein [Candidatus Accumulibacter appositus]HRF03369.1 YaeQ family protein [Accumulibacter sp.]